ncbi:MAG: calcium-binding protein, partial [Burkholderiales bacterium]|nr:calcium-binding protein [Burkholderiales bacterium]
VAGIDTITDFKVGEDTLTILSGATAKVSFIGGTTVTYNAVSNSGILNISIAAGTTTVTGSTGADSITGSAGTDSIDGGAGNDTIVGGLGNDTIIGGSSDTITVDAGTDTITNFNIVNDTLTINSGATAKVTFSGGSNVNYNPVSNLGILDITIAAGTSSVTGSIGADSITGSAGSDSIDGGSGNDTITGGLGSDSITASIGTDTITDFTVGADQLTINAGAIAHVYTSGSNSYVNVVTNNGTLYIDGITAGGTQSITGSTGRDSIVGGAYNDTITGGNGDDTISGGSGRNTINVDSGIDTITDFLLSYDTLNVSSGATAYLYAFTIANGGLVDYTTITNSGTLYIDGSTTYSGTQITGVEYIIGSTGADFIVGGRGNDTLYGGLGNDTFTGGAGNDLIKVDANSTDTITDFNPSSDTLEIISGATARVYASGTVSYMTSVTNDGKLYIDGSTTYTGTAITAAASITGTNKADSIIGGSGADTITGGTGIDTLTGGAGADTFVFGTNGSLIPQTQANPLLISNQDSISDFTSGTDLIRFAGTVVFNKVTIPNGVTGVSVDDYGFATFYDSSNPNPSYSDKIIALQASTTTKTAQTVSLFVDGTDTYVFFAGATVGTGDDQVIKLTGVSGRFFDEITVNGTDITIS